jgi:tetratricopeptide (TPR) repeat protein
VNGYSFLEWISKIYLAIFFTFALSGFSLAIIFNNHDRSLENIDEIEQTSLLLNSIESYLTEQLNESIDDQRASPTGYAYFKHHILANLSDYYDALEEFLEATKINTPQKEADLSYVSQRVNVDYQEILDSIEWSHRSINDYKDRLDSRLNGYTDHKAMPIKKIAEVLTFINRSTHQIIDQNLPKEGRNYIREFVFQNKRDDFNELALGRWRNGQGDSRYIKVTHGNTLDFVNNFRSLPSKYKNLTPDELRSQIKNLGSSKAKYINAHYGNDSFVLIKSLPTFTIYKASYYLIVSLVFALGFLLITYFSIALIVKFSPEESQFDMQRNILFPLEYTSPFIRIFSEIILFLPVLSIILMMTADYNPHNYNMEVVSEAFLKEYKIVTLAGFKFWIYSFYTIYCLTLIGRISLRKLAKFNDESLNRPDSLSPN